MTTPGRPYPLWLSRAAAWIRAWPMDAGWLQKLVVLPVAGIGAATFFLLAVHRFLGEGDTALLYMPVIIVMAALGGVRTGVMSAVLGFFVAKYLFVPTYYSMYMQDPRDWVSLGVFVLLGLAMGLQTNRTRRHQLELQWRERESARLQCLAAQADGLREADRLKSNLVSSVSHELKTPLAIVTAIVTNLLESDLDWEADAVRVEMRQAADALRRLNASIGDLLDVSRLESGSWMPRREWHDVGDILDTVREKMPAVQQPRLRFDVAPDLPMIHVDHVQWTRMLCHLVENALTYSTNTTVTVRAAVDNDEIRIEVEDDGPGVQPHEAARIFEKFYRGSAAAAAPAGTGLGLAISHDIVDFHGGRIWVEPRSPRGARFVVAMGVEAQPVLEDVRLG